MRPIICIDAGHGGKDPGAVGPAGLMEKDVALSVAMLMGAMLTSDCEVAFTRRDDTFIELGNRAMIANDTRADAFVSIHCNSGPPGSGEGFEVFTSPGQTDSDKLATSAFIAFATEFPEKRKRMDLADGDEDKEAKFTVLTRTHMRSVLFELEFIHTLQGEAWLRHPKSQARCAKALAAGIIYHFALRGRTANPASPIVQPFLEGADEEIPLKTLIGGKISELQTLVSKL